MWDGAGRESLNSLMATGSTACTAGAAGSRGKGPGLALPATTDTERWAVNKSPCCCWRAFTASLHSSAPFERTDQRLRQRQGFIFNAFCAQEQLHRGGFGAASFPLGPPQSFSSKQCPLLQGVQAKPAWFYPTKHMQQKLPYYNSIFHLSLRLCFASMLFNNEQDTFWLGAAPTTPTHVHRGPDLPEASTIPMAQENQTVERREQSIPCKEPLGQSNPSNPSAHPALLPAHQD